MLQRGQGMPAVQSKLIVVVLDTDHDVLVLDI